MSLFRYICREKAIFECHFIEDFQNEKKMSLQYAKIM